ncbi:MAG: hypothetical protein Q8K99_06855, partial [Actinomycetota bacterium]|nr:hypothetical protein [Actinomycetota bacterium]
MIRRYASVLGLLLAGYLFVPETALAAAPPQTPATMLSEGFETATSPSYVIQPIIVYPANGNAYWGRITQRKKSGSYGLWCAGTGAATWPLYTDNSSGRATFNLTQTADYYSSSLSFAYTQPSYGEADNIAFAYAWWPENDQLGA